jgi:hypothetical protein
MTNKCIVKYINLHDVLPRLHEPGDFEFACAVICHSSFDEMHQRAFDACPLGFRCVEPIALRHQVLWSLGLNVLRDSTGNRVWERDDLMHAIDKAEYDELWRKKDKPLSLCVDVIESPSIFITSCYDTMQPAPRPFLL